MTVEIPSIQLHAHEQISDQMLNQLLLGAEEESVPVRVSRHDVLNPLTLAHNAARSSRLGVGIGVSLSYAVVTVDKLPEERPFLAQFFNREPRLDRFIGSNAARLVKRLPLREVRTVQERA